MARTDNFENFLTDVADAIREKTGITHTLSPASYDTLIRSILPVENTPDDSVRFIDYDGTIVYSFKKHDFLMRTEMPELPTHLGLTNAGWNWTLESARRQVAEIGVFDIGCQYYTADDTFRIVLDIPTDNFETGFYCHKSGTGTGFIDWGDGSEPSTNPFKYADRTDHAGHVYAKAGRYMITVSQTNKTYSADFHIDNLPDGDFINNEELIAELYYPESASYWSIQVYSGKNIEKLVYYDDPNLYRDHDSTFYTSLVFPLKSLGKLKHLAIPPSYHVSYHYPNEGIEWTFLGDYWDAPLIESSEPREAYKELLKEEGWVDEDTGKIYWDWIGYDCQLKTLCIPELEDPEYDKYPCEAELYTSDSYQYISNKWMEFGLSSLGSLRLPSHSSMTLMPTLSTMYLEDYNELVKYLPKTITHMTGGHLDDSITQYTQTIYLPDSVTYIGRTFLHRLNLYDECRLTVMMPENLEYLGPYFAMHSPSNYSRNNGTLVLDFRKVKKVVTLGDIDYSGEPEPLHESTKLIVPDELYDDWIIATNWATYYKDNIVKASEYDASLES